jgi:PAS domain S-box-containing protein
MPSGPAAHVRLRFILFLGATNIVFTVFDLSQVPAGSDRTFVLIGRTLLTVLLIGGPLALHKVWGTVAARWIARILGVGTAAGFGAVVWGTGGSQSPYFLFLAILPIVFTVAVPEDLPASALSVVSTFAMGVARLCVENLPPFRLAFWIGSFGCTGAYAFFGMLLYGHMHRREAEVREALVARERLRTSEENERQLVAKQLDVVRRFSNDILLLIDARGDIVAANDRAVAAYGYSEQELRERGVRGIRALESLPSYEGELRDALAANGMRFTTFHRRRDGSTFPVDVTSIPLELDGRRFLQSIIRDVSEEKAARAETEHRAVLLDRLFDAVIGIAPTGAITRWNPAAERLFGWSAEEALGKDFLTLLPTDYFGVAVEETQAKADRGEPVRLEVRRKARAGNWIDMEMTSMAIRGADGAVSEYISVSRDISISKMAQNALRKGEERLRQILETCNEGILVLNGLGRLEFANARMSELFGRSHVELMGRPLAEIVGDSHTESAQEDLARLKGGETFQREIKARRPDGSERWVVISGSPLKDGDGRPNGAVMVFIDVTAHRRAQEQLLQSQKMEAVGRLASGIAHDFNNLLVVILSNSSFLVDAFPEGDERREDARQIRDAGERAQRLVRQLLAFGRRGTARPTPHDVNGLVQGLEKLLRRTIGEDVAVRLALASETCRVRIDPGHVEQLLMNLAVNARDAMPGGGEIRIETELVALQQPPPGCETLAPGRYVIVRVVDNGVGMTPEVKARIFEPFFTTKERGHGTGLGLATVYGIVQQVKGGITVDTATGRGTAFSVYLPVCEAAESDEAPAPEPIRARGRGETILIAEDEEGVRAVARRILERNGFQVIEASDGSDALRRFQEHGHVDAVLSDVVMPGISALELVEGLERLSPQLPIVFMSGYADRQVGGRPVLHKPFNEHDLVTRIQEALAGKRRRPAVAGTGNAA